MQISMAGMLFLTFLVLKLTGVIAWSWLWVTCPLWATAGLVFGLLACLYRSLGAFNI